TSVPRDAVGCSSSSSSAFMKEGRGVSGTSMSNTGVKGGGLTARRLDVSSSSAVSSMSIALCCLCAGGQLSEHVLLVSTPGSNTSFSGGLLSSETSEVSKVSKAG